MNSSDRSESSNSTARSEQSLQEQEEAILSRCASIRHDIASLVEDVDAGNLFEGFDESETAQRHILPSASVPVSPTPLRERRENRSSYFRSRSTEDLISGHPHQAVRHSSLGGTFGDRFLKEIPVYDSQELPEQEEFIDLWPKTRQSVRRGDRSPLGNHQQGVPRRTRKKKNIVNNLPEMASDSDDAVAPLGGAPTDPPKEPTPQWDMFFVRGTNFSRSLDKELIEMAAALDDEETEQSTFEDMITDIEDMEQELKELEVNWKSLMSIEKIDPIAWSDTGDKIRVNRKSIAKIKKKVQKVLGLSTGQIAGKSVVSGNDDLVAALRSVTQAPVVNLPTFDGTKLSDYVGFKKKFNFVMAQLGISEKLWSSHLHDALLGKAKEYVGSKDDWFDKLPELWERLDDKYANRWVLANNTIKDFVYKPLPDSQPEDVNKYFYSQVDALKRVLELNMTLEQVGVNIICQSLPDEIGRDLRAGLRALHPDKKKSAFTIKEIVKVYNDVISINGMAGASESIHSTLCLRSGVNPSSGGGHSGSRGRGYSNQPQSNPSGRSRGRGRGYRGRGGFGQSRPPQCMLCADIGQPPTIGHSPWKCVRFSNPVQIRERLKALNLCMACAGTVHTGDCPTHVICTFHTGAKHRNWTCGHQEGHPGKQEP